MSNLISTKKLFTQSFTSLVLCLLVGPVPLQATELPFIELKRDTDTSVSSAIFSPDGKKIVTISNVARIWDAVTGRELRTLDGHKRSIQDRTISVTSSASFSPDGKKIATIGGDFTALIWNIESDEKPQTLRGGPPPALSAFFSPDGTRIVTPSPGPVIAIYSVESGKPVRILSGHTHEVLGTVFSQDGKKIVSISGALDGTSRIWDAESGKELQQFQGIAVISPDGKKIVVTDRRTNIVRILDAESGEELKKLEGILGRVPTPIFSPDGTKIITKSGTNMPPRKNEEDNMLQIWDVESGKELHKLHGHTSFVWSVAFSPDGLRIVTTGDQTAIIWDTELGKELKKLEGHTRSVYAATFSPDGKRIVTASGDGTARIWALE